MILRGFTVEASLADGIDVVAGHDVCIQACEIRNTRELGVSVTGGVKNRVEDCDIHDTGTGGIVLAGGDRRTLTPGGHEAVNNHIWRFSALKLTYSQAIQLEGVGNRAAHNLIHDVPHEAIGIVGNDHVFEYNVVHHVCSETDDSGAMHKGRNPSCRGNIYRYNFWYDIGRPMGHGTAAIYFDDGDGGDIVFGNIFLRCGDPGRGSFGTVFSHGGRDNLAENNIFIACKRAIGLRPVGRRDLERRHQRRPRLLLDRKTPQGSQYHQATVHHPLSRVNRLHGRPTRREASQPGGPQRLGELRRSQKRQLAGRCERELVQRPQPRFHRRRQGGFPSVAQSRSVLEVVGVSADAVREDRPAKDAVSSDPSAGSAARRVVEAADLVNAASRRVTLVVLAAYIAPKRRDAASTINRQTSATPAG